MKWRSKKYRQIANFPNGDILNVVIGNCIVEPAHIQAGKGDAW